MIDYLGYLAGLGVLYYASLGFVEYIRKVKMSDCDKCGLYWELCECDSVSVEELEEMVTEYDRFLLWMHEERPGVILTEHQHTVCQAWLNGVSIESLGGHDNAFGKVFILNLVNSYMAWRAE